MVFWIQIHGLPLSHLTAENGRVIGETLGTLIAVDAGEDRVFGFGFVRVRVGLSTNVPLQRKTTVLLGDKPITLKLRYERLPHLCAWCGFLDHEEEDCTREKTFDEKGEPKRLYKSWIRAEVDNFPVTEVGLGLMINRVDSAEAEVAMREIPVDTVEGQSVRGKAKVRDEGDLGQAGSDMGLGLGRASFGSPPQAGPDRSLVPSPGGIPSGPGTSKKKKVHFEMGSSSSAGLQEQIGWVNDGPVQTENRTASMTEPVHEPEYQTEPTEPDRNFSSRLHANQYRSFFQPGLSDSTSARQGGPTPRRGGRLRTTARKSVPRPRLTMVAIVEVQDDPIEDNTPDHSTEYGYVTSSDTASGSLTASGTEPEVEEDPSEG